MKTMTRLFHTPVIVIADVLEMHGIKAKEAMVLP